MPKKKSKTTKSKTVSTGKFGDVKSKQSGVTVTHKTNKINTLAYTIIPIHSRSHTKYSAITMKLDIDLDNPERSVISYIDIQEPTSIAHAFNEYKYNSARFMKTMWSDISKILKSPTGTEK